MTYSLSRKNDNKHENLSRRQRLNLQQRDEILEVALRLFSEKSYSNVSMQEIAKEAEFGMGRLHKFFDSKEDLYKALVVLMAEKWHHNVLQALEKEKNPLRAIEKCISVHRELFYENLQFVHLFFNGAFFHVTPTSEPDLHKFRDEYLEKLAIIFEKGIKAKVFHDGDPNQMALALYGVILTFLFRMNEDPAGFEKGNELSTVRDIFLWGVMRNREGKQDG